LDESYRIHRWRVWAGVGSDESRDGDLVTSEVLDRLDEDAGAVTMLQEQIDALNSIVIEVT
jgi:hypothetical protein